MLIGLLLYVNCFLLTKSSTMNKRGKVLAQASNRKRRENQSTSHDNRHYGVKFDRIDWEMHSQWTSHGVIQVKTWKSWVVRRFWVLDADHSMEDEGKTDDIGGEKSCVGSEHTVSNPVARWISEGWGLRAHRATLTLWANVSPFIEAFTLNYSLLEKLLALNKYVLSGG